MDLNNTIASITDNKIPATTVYSTSSGGSDSTLSFADVLNQTDQAAGMTAISTGATTGRWHGLGFLATIKAPKVEWPWIDQYFSQIAVPTAASEINQRSGLILPDVLLRQQQAAPLSATAVQAVNSTSPQFDAPMPLAAYPHPTADNGCGIHWIPTVSQSAEEVDRYIQEAVNMGMKWVVFLNEGSNIGNNDYLVKRLTQAGIEPVMRVYTPGLVPVEGDLPAMVKHYRQLGVNYFQLYNEPNLLAETNGQAPNVNNYVNLWSNAAREVLKAGGLPGFGALSPQGDTDDRTFLQQALNRLKETGQDNLLNHGWLSMHNYAGARPISDPDGFMRFKQYNAIIQEVLGRSIPIIGTEGGTFITKDVSQDQQINLVTSAYRYMQHREPYNFSYTYWIIANGHDPAWNGQALFTPNGATPLAQALKNMASGGLV